MRPRVRLVIGLGTVALLLGGTLPTHATCAPPAVLIDKYQARPGDTVDVTGQAWVSGCDDHEGSGGGCAVEDDAEPLRGIELRLKGPKTDQTRQELNVGSIGETDVDILLANVDANDQGSFTKTIKIPAVPPGVYFITGISELPAYQPPELLIERGA